MSESDDWARVDRLLEAALEQPVDERRAWLTDACDSDELLEAKVLKLLTLAEEDDDLLTPGGAFTGAAGQAVAEALEKSADPELLVGSHLGPYEIRALIGTGGMGRVYRAHDPKLERDVALKALSGTLVTEPRSLRRFEREARILANLNHPNIGGIHDLQVYDGRPYLVLELVEGETLAEVLARRRLSREEAIDCARQVAAALEEAHSKGIVHRDLKPANIKIARDGHVKVLDFGIARRAVKRHDSGVQTAVRVTQEGAIVGTPSFMSPEQARGDEVDGRTDIWALGCLLFEMLTGRPAFDGSTASDILAAVLRDEIDLSGLPSHVDRSLRRIVERCLQKDLRRRFQHAGDVRIELEDVEQEIEGSASEARRASPAKSIAPWVVAGLASLLAVFLFFGRDQGRTVESKREVAQFVLDLPPGQRLPAGDYTSPVALSPDASAVVLVAEDDEEGHLYLRNLEHLDWAELPGTAGAWQPFFSPDGTEVAFFSRGRLQRMALDGGTPLTVVRVGLNPRGGAWTPDGTIVFGPSQTSGLSRVDARGGDSQPLTEVDISTHERSHRWPQVLPDGKRVLMTVDFDDRTFDDAALAVADIETGQHRIVLQGGAYGRYLPSGHLLFARAGRLFAVPFDQRTATVTGDLTLALNGVAYDLRNGGTKIAVAGDGTLAFVPGFLHSEERRLVWLGEDGRHTQLTRRDGRYHDPILSPDRRRIALRIGDPEASDVWTLDLASGTLAQVTFGLKAVRPIWTPDSRSLTVGVNTDSGWQLLNLDADGVAAAVELRQSSNRLYPGAWSADGRTLLIQERGESAGWDLLTLDTDPTGVPSSTAEPLVATAANETNPALSPDGRFLAYESDQVDGLVNVYVRPFDQMGAQVMVSTGGGRWPQWGGNGELYYWSSFNHQIRRVRQRMEDERFLLEDTEIIWAGGAEPIVVSLSEFLGRGFDFDPEGQRFLMLEVSGAAAEGPPRVVVALGFPETLSEGLED